MHIQPPFGNNCWQFSEILYVGIHTRFNTLLSQMNTYFTFRFTFLSIYSIILISLITYNTYYCEITSQFIFIWSQFIFFIIVSLSWFLFCLCFIFYIFSSFCLFSVYFHMIQSFLFNIYNILILFEQHITYLN